MVETITVSDEAADIIARVMAEMEEVFGLINRPRSWFGDRVAEATIDLPAIALASADPL